MSINRSPIRGITRSPIRSPLNRFDLEKIFKSFILFCKPTLKEDNTLVWRDYSRRRPPAVLYDATYLQFDGTNDKVETSELTFKSIGITTKPDSSDEPVLEVLSEQRSEKVTNGGFDSDSGWIKETGWTISGGRAIHIGSSPGTLRQTDIMNTTKFYLVKFKIVEYTDGLCGIPGFILPGGFYPNAVGSYSIVMKPSDNDFGIYSTGDNAVDNISVKEIPTISLNSGTVETTGFTNPTTFNSAKGDWKTIAVSQDTDIIGKVNLGKVGQFYYGGGAYNLITAPKNVSATEWQTITNHPEWNRSDIENYLGVAPESCHIFRMDEGSGDYCIDSGQDLGSELITGDSSTFDSSVGDWVGTRDGSISAINGEGQVTTGANTYSGISIGDILTTNKIYIHYFDQRLISGNIQLWRNANSEVKFTPTTEKKRIYLLEKALNENFQITQGILEANNTIAFDNIHSREIQAATISGATWQNGQTTGNHHANKIFTKETINGDTVVLPSPDGINDYFGNAINPELLYNGKGINLSPFDYATFDPITIAKAGGSILVEFVVRNFNGSVQHILSNLQTLYQYFGIEINSQILESNTDTDLWINSTESLTVGSDYKIIVIASSGTVTTKINGSIVDTQTPSDDFTVGKISSSDSGFRLDGWLKRIVLSDFPVVQSEIDDLVKFMDKACPDETYWDMAMSRYWEQVIVGYWDHVMNERPQEPSDYDIYTFEIDSNSDGIADGLTAVSDGGGTGTLSIESGMQKTIHTGGSFYGVEIDNLEIQAGETRDITVRSKSDGQWLIAPSDDTGFTPIQPDGNETLNDQTFTITSTTTTKIKYMVSVNRTLWLDKVTSRTHS